MIFVVVHRISHIARPTDRPTTIVCSGGVIIVIGMGIISSRKIISNGAMCVREQSEW